MPLHYPAIDVGFLASRFYVADVTTLLRLSTLVIRSYCVAKVSVTNDIAMLYRDVFSSWVTFLKKIHGSYVATFNSIVLIIYTKALDTRNDST